MRRLTILGALAVLVVLLSAALAVLRDVPAALPVPPQQQEAYRMLYTRPRQDFKQLTVTLASGESYTVLSDMGFDAQGNLLGVYNGLGQPVVVQGQEGFALDSTSYQMMLLAAMNLPVTASYPGLDLEACGLATPSARLEIHYHTGEKIVLNIGSTTASGQSCYVRMAGDEDIHLVPVDFRQVLTRPLTAHHRLPGSLNKAASAAVQIAIVRPDGENFIASNYGTSGRILPWQADKPYVHAGSTERITAFVEAVAAIRAEGYVETLGSAADMAQYGLDNPTRLLVAYSDGTIRDIHLGSDAGDGTVYARLDATADVYRVSTAHLPPADDAAVDALLDRFVALVSSNDVASVAIRAGEEAWLLAISPDGYAINGRAADADVFSGAYRAVVGMQFDKTTKAAPAGEEICEVRFLHGDGTITRVVYHDYDHHYVQAETSGGGGFLLRRERLEDMLTTLKEAAQ